MEWLNSYNVTFDNCTPISPEFDGIDPLLRRIVGAWHYGLVPDERKNLAPLESVISRTRGDYKLTLNRALQIVESMAYVAESLADKLGCRPSAARLVECVGGILNRVRDVGSDPERHELGWSKDDFRWVSEGEVGWKVHAGLKGRATLSFGDNVVFIHIPFDFTSSDSAKRAAKAIVPAEVFRAEKIASEIHEEAWMLAPRKPDSQSNKHPFLLACGNAVDALCPNTFIPSRNFDESPFMLGAYVVMTEVWPTLSRLLWALCNANLEKGMDVWVWMNRMGLGVVKRVAGVK